jgi:rhodanese-related sulfurtransferase
MITAPELLRIRWNKNLTRNAAGAPLIAPLFAAEQGPAIQIADIRSLDKATGVLGYIPGSAFTDVERLEKLAREATVTAPLVLVSASGDTAAKFAQQLEQRGMQNVAAMSGGLAAWRDLGLGTSRDAAGVREKFQRVAEAESGSLTLEHIREHIGDPRSVRWIKLASMIAHGRISCIDGRDERGVVGSPGGDGGEFLLFLAAIEQATGGKLDDATVQQGLLAHLDTFGHFCVHTDVHAFENLTRALLADQRLHAVVAGLTEPEEWAAFLHKPAPELRDALLEHLVDPAHIGCGHIRLMLQHSDEYGVRPELVLAFLRAYYRLWWEGAAELQLTTLPGGHEEGAVVNIRLAEDVLSLSNIALISPQCGGQQMFVNHPDISAYLRQATVRYLARGVGPLSVAPAQEGELQAAVDELAARQMTATLGYLAKGLPVFEVIFSADGSFDVREA